MKQRVSKVEAERSLNKSRATIDRMISRGELETELEPHGSRHRVWVLLDNPEDSREDSQETSVESSHETSTKGEDATLRERIKGLEELVSYYQQQLKDSEWRYQQLFDTLSSSQRTVESSQRTIEAFARALPEPPAAADTSEPEQEPVTGKHGWLRSIFG